MSKKLNLVIFGATGRTGSLMVNQALSQGHMVTAFMRSPAKLAGAGVQAGHSRLRLIQGDLKEPETVARAIAGQDAVICAVGAGAGLPPEALAAMAQNLIAGMHAHQVNRIISLVGTGVQSPLEGLPLAGLLLALLPGRDKGRDFQGFADLLQASDLVWTLVRPPRLTDGKKLGQYRTGLARLGLSSRIARADVADFMLKLATEGGFERQAPRISY